MRIQADRGVCIGAGMCVMTSEVVFDQDDDGIVVLLTEHGRVPDDELQRVRDAAGLCPSGALSVLE